MKVLLLAADKGGCYKYRVSEPARVTKALGVDVEVSHDLPIEGTINSATKLHTVKSVETDADVIVFQRPLDNGMYQAILQAKRQGIATVVEIDDDLAGVDPNNMAYNVMYGHKHSGVEWLIKSCQAADYLITSTNYLQGKYGHGGNGAVLRNYVPESIFDITPRYERTDETKAIGWTGSVDTHPSDLQTTKGEVYQAMLRNDLSISLIGNKPYHSMLCLGIPTDHPMHNTGWVPLEDYYEEMADNIDIGIVPLEKTAFNTAKSYLKGIEMAALGIPFIATDTYEYSVLSAYGVGKLATRPKDWGKHIDRFCQDRNKLVSVAKDYRDRIRTNYTYELHASEWVNAWEEASRIRKN